MRTLRRVALLGVVAVVLGLVLTAPASAAEQDVLTEIRAIKEHAPTYADDFSIDSGRWGTWSSNGSGAHFENQALRIRQDEAGSVTQAEGSMYVEDFYMEVETTHVSGTLDDEFGILFHVADDRDFYWFAISSDGYYALYDFYGDSFSYPVAWTRSESINYGAHTTNHLGLLVQGARAVLLVNGSVLADVDLARDEIGEINLAVGTYDDARTEIDFDNLRIWDLEQLPDPAASAVLSDAEMHTPVATAQVTAYALNVRKGPGASHPIIGVVSMGDTLHVTDGTDDCSWLAVRTPQGISGWVSGRHAVLDVSCGELRNQPDSPAGDTPVDSDLSTAVLDARDDQPSGQAIPDAGDSSQQPDDGNATPGASREIESSSVSDSLAASHTASDYLVVTLAEFVDALPDGCDPTSSVGCITAVEGYRMLRVWVEAVAEQAEGLDLREIGAEAYVVDNHGTRHEHSGNGWASNRGDYVVFAVPDSAESFMLHWPANDPVALAP